MRQVFGEKGLHARRARRRERVLRTLIQPILDAVEQTQMLSAQRSFRRSVDPRSLGSDLPSR